MKQLKKEHFQASRKEAATTSLGNLFQCLITLTEKVLPNICSKSTLFQFQAITLCSINKFYLQTIIEYIINKVY